MDKLLIIDLLKKFEHLTIEDAIDIGPKTYKVVDWTNTKTFFDPLFTSSNKEECWEFIVDHVNSLKPKILVDVTELVKQGKMQVIENGPWVYSDTKFTP